MEKKRPLHDIEAKWQAEWEKSGIYHAADPTLKPKTQNLKPNFYGLVEFPYPSGDGLHVGHPRSYMALDVVTRKHRMMGENVLYPMGWDAFGLPTENFAIKNKIKPQDATKKNIANFKRQIQMLGIGFDWSREINTTDPTYYKWTQWQFLQFFNAWYDEHANKARPIDTLPIPAGVKELGDAAVREYQDNHRMAYKAASTINWCPRCKIGLANEEAIGGTCERCGNPVEKRQKEQWMIRITKYAERLLNDLDTVDYLDKIKAQQKNWIGKSEGAYVDFAIETDNSPQPPLSLRGGAERKARGRGVTRDRVTVFTTRPDTIFGATYLVLAPEHPLVARWIDEESVTNAKEAQKYQKAASKRTEQERTASFDSAPLGVTRGLRQDKKTGVVLEGVFAINPASQEKIPVWIADYVLGGYGTGAIMAVPAHDERDFAFAKKFGLPIKPVVGLAFKQDGKDKKLESLLLQMLKLGQEHNKRLIISGGWGVDILVGRRLRNHDDIDCNVPYEEVAWWKAKLEAMGFEQIPPNDAKKDSRYHVNLHRQDGDIIKVDIIGLGIDEKGVIYDMEWGSPDSWKFSAVNGIQKSVFQGLPTEVFSTEVQAWLKIYSRQKDALDKAALGVAPWIEEGVSMNSDFLDGLLTKEATAKIIDWLEKNKTGERAVMYKLRDWVFSRQRYWGEPIPIVICKKCGFVPVPDAQLPVTLPDVDAYEPTDTGESPLAKIESWVATKCPHCGGKAKRETDTMPNWAGSSWYFIRYVDPHNDHALASKENMQAWLPVDLYNGGMEHTTLHLLYSRFWYKFLFDLGIVPASCGSEPYRSRRSHGLIMAPDGEKMSKSKGNVINPDDIVKVYGADVFRVYELFMGPFDQAVPWDTNGIEGVRRFLDKAWGLLTPPLAPPQGGGGSDSPPHRGGVEASEAQLRRGGVSLETLYNQTLKKITTGIDQLQFNTCVSALMILTNAFQDAGGIPEVFRVGYLKMLAPFAPHLAEELWHQAGSGKSGSGKLKVESDKSIHTSEWPTFDPGKLQASTVELVVQINGKVREKMMVDAEITEEEAKEKVLASATVQKWLEGKTPKKVVYVKGKILSIVV